MRNGKKKSSQEMKLSILHNLELETMYGERIVRKRRSLWCCEAQNTHANVMHCRIAIAATAVIAIAANVLAKRPTIM